MYKKAILFNDLASASKILEQKNPRIQKRLGRKVKNFDYKKWDDSKNEIVYTANRYKFNQSDKLKNILLSTENKQICEASPSDKIWGIGITKKQAISGVEMDGQNLLGIAIMKVRNDMN